MIHDEIDAGQCKCHPSTWSHTSPTVVCTQHGARHSSHACTTCGHAKKCHATAQPIPTPDQLDLPKFGAVDAEQAREQVAEWIKQAGRTGGDSITVVGSEPEPAMSRDYREGYTAGKSAQADGSKAVAWLDEHGALVRREDIADGGFVRADGAYQAAWTPLYKNAQPGSFKAGAEWMRDSALVAAPKHTRGNNGDLHTGYLFGVSDYTQAIRAINIDSAIAQGGGHA